MKRTGGLRGFTLVELLVVMAILAVLIALALYGIGFAMRRSRNTHRRAAVENMVIALGAYYSENRRYLDVLEGEEFAEVFGPDSQADADPFALQEFLESTFDAPPETRFYYNTNDNLTMYTVCVNQEEWNADDEWICDGTGVGSDGFPPKELGSMATCSPDCGVCGLWNGDTWEVCGT
jgi:prepilin-type N-terminal cleavage/methylation domain-containing protein